MAGLDRERAIFSYHDRTGGLLRQVGFDDRIFRCDIDCSACERHHVSIVTVAGGKLATSEIDSTASKLHGTINLGIISSTGVGAEPQIAMLVDIDGAASHFKRTISTKRCTGIPFTSTFQRYFTALNH